MVGADAPILFGLLLAWSNAWALDVRRFLGLGRALSRP